MGKAKVEEKKFDERPVLFFVGCRNEMNLYFFHFLKEKWYFEDNNQFEIVKNVSFIRNIDYEHDDHRQID